METTIRFLFVAALWLFVAGSARADQFGGNGSTGLRGAIGNGTLTLTYDGTNISGTLSVGGPMCDVLVLYIQNGPGGFTSTSGFNDQSYIGTKAISAVSSLGRSVLTFANGFQPNYALVLAPAAGTCGLWALANGGNYSMPYLDYAYLSPVGDYAGPYSFHFPGSRIGMTPGVRSTIQVFGTYVCTDGYRSSEAIAGDLEGYQGYNPFTQTAYANCTFEGGARAINPPPGAWSERTGSSPSAREAHTAVWTGSEMIIWGGDGTGGYLNDGARFNPTANVWSALPAGGSPAARHEHTAVWTGSEMIVWGGHNATNCFNDGGRYNPANNSWTTLAAAGAPSARFSHSAVWTGSEMIVWGGWNDSGFLNNGGCYNPTLNSWTAVSTTGSPAARDEHTAIWTGTEMIVWGGYAGWHCLSSGGRYSPASNSWTPLSGVGAPLARSRHTAVWTGNEMIVWGGLNTSPFRDGARYNPVLDRWIGLPMTGAPGERYGHAAVWTGSEMIIWGGGSECYLGFFRLNDGRRYSPMTNGWTALPTTNAPAARAWSPAIWTGSEMILFGGYSEGGYLADTWSFYPYAPTVQVFRSGPSSALVTWPVWSSTLRLCQTTNLVSGQWTTVTNAVSQVGSENHITVSPLSGRQFFRAEYP